MRLRVELRDERPPVWREVIMPFGSTLDLLHDVIQVVMGWEDRHAYQFEQAGTRYEDGGKGDACLNGELDARDVPLDRLAYIYELGPQWWHEITVREVEELEPIQRLRMTYVGSVDDSCNIVRLALG